MHPLVCGISLWAMRRRLQGRCTLCAQDLPGSPRAGWFIRVHPDTCLHAGFEAATAHHAASRHGVPPARPTPSDTASLPSATNRVLYAAERVPEEAMVIAIEGGVAWRAPLPAGRATDRASPQASSATPTGTGAELVCFAYVVVRGPHSALLSHTRSAEFLLPPVLVQHVQAGEGRKGCYGLVHSRTAPFPPPLHPTLGGAATPRRHRCATLP